MSDNNSVVVIPARLQSTRLPGKVLYPLAGKAMIEWVYSACIQSKANAVYIATHDTPVQQYCIKHSMRYIMTSANPINGSERVAEAVRLLEEWGETYQYVINVQGDEPLINPSHINLLLDRMKHKDYLTSNPMCEMATLYSKIYSIKEREASSVVKVVLDKFQTALYFSRLPISDFKHHGIYAYTWDALNIVVQAAKTENEMRENLEQLRALDNGYRISCIEVDSTLHGVDCYEDIPKVENFLNKRN
jgi:3-deoxy-manno-octulosonate cytidylyltransferase (CMP-KDO synthetase)